MTLPLRSLLLAPLVTIVLARPAAADLWCAWPLYVHEWGVHVLGPDGAAAPGDALPAWFHTTVGGAASEAPAVRTLPADNGVRKLPVVHFYAPSPPGEPVPVGLEVGFAHGSASAWFPAVDLFRTAAVARGPDAAVARLALLAARDARTPWQAVASVPPDPTRQLVWNRLELTAAAPAAPAAPAPAWVEAARRLPALWVSRGAESERFAFYEADTSERTPLALRRLDGWTPTRRAYALDNAGPHPVHDVFVVVREPDAAFVVFIARVDPGQRAGFVLEDARVAPGRVAAATADRLRALLVDPTAPDGPPAATRPSECVTGRDPAIPLERAHGHSLYRGEVDVLLAAWGERFFERPGARVLYREDEAALDEAMPLSIYTSMQTYVVLERAGLALWTLDHLP